MVHSRAADVTVSVYSVIDTDLVDVVDVIRHPRVIALRTAFLALAELLRCISDDLLGNNLNSVT